MSQQFHKISKFTCLIETTRSTKKWQCTSLIYFHTADIITSIDHSRPPSSELAKFKHTNSQARFLRTVHLCFFHLESRRVVDCNHNYRGHARLRAEQWRNRVQRESDRRKGLSALFFEGERRGKGSKSNTVLRRDLG